MIIEDIDMYRISVIQHDPESRMTVSDRVQLFSSLCNNNNSHELCDLPEQQTVIEEKVVSEGDYDNLTTPCFHHSLEKRNKPYLTLKRLSLKSEEGFLSS